MQSKIVDAILFKVSSLTAPQPNSTRSLTDTGSVTPEAVRPAANSLFSSTSRPRLVVQTSDTAMVTDFVYSPNAKLLATLGADGVVKIWLTSKGQEIVSSRLHCS